MLFNVDPFQRRAAEAGIKFDCRAAFARAVDMQTPSVDEDIISRPGERPKPGRRQSQPLQAFA